jgi:hypothetical protein
MASFFGQVSDSAVFKNLITLVILTASVIVGLSTKKQFGQLPCVTLVPSVIQHF